MCSAHALFEYYRLLSQCLSVIIPSCGWVGNTKYVFWNNYCITATELCQFMMTDHLQHFLHHAKCKKTLISNAITQKLWEKIITADLLCDLLCISSCMYWIDFNFYCKLQFGCGSLKVMSAIRGMYCLSSP